MTSKECIKCIEKLPIDMFEISKKGDNEYYSNKCKELYKDHYTEESFKNKLII